MIFKLLVQIYNLCRDIVQRLWVALTVESKELLVIAWHRLTFREVGSPPPHLEFSMRLSRVQCITKTTLRLRGWCLPDFSSVSSPPMWPHTISPSIRSSLRTWWVWPPCKKTKSLGASMPRFTTYHLLWAELCLHLPPHHQIYMLKS